MVEREKRIRRKFDDLVNQYGDDPRVVEAGTDDSRDCHYAAACARLIRPHDHVLDFGCGRGELLEYIIELTDSRIDYDGWDISPEMIKLCKQRYTSEDWWGDDLSFVFKVKSLSDVSEKIPLFDVVIATGVVMYYPPAEVWEMIRKLFRLTWRALSFNVYLNSCPVKYIGRHYFDAKEVIEQVLCIGQEELGTLDGFVARTIVGYIPDTMVVHMMKRANYANTVFD